MIDRIRTLFIPKLFRVFLHLGIMLQCAVLGCKHSPRQTMTGLWGSVSQTPWSRTEGHEDPKNPEASVVANAAIPAGSIQDSETAKNSDGNSDTSTSSDNPSSLSRKPQKGNRSETYAGASDSTNSRNKPGTGTAIPSAEMADASLAQTASATRDEAQQNSNAANIDRLKAALDEDEQRAQEPSRHLGTAHDVRTRVESLLDRAKRLFASGRLREARHTAQIAQDLGDTARLDFLPGEEQPVDLLHEIDDQMRDAAQPTSESDDAPSAVASNSSTPPATTGTASSSNVNSRSMAATGDAASRSKPRREWGYGLNVFRRERKPGATDQPAIASQTSNPDAAQSPKPVLVQLGLEAGSEQSNQQDDAEVQANRSVTLTAHRPTESTRVPIDDRANGSDTDSDPSEPAKAVEEVEKPRITAFENSAVFKTPAEATWQRERMADARPQPSDDDEASAVEFDKVRPIARFHDVARKRPVDRVTESGPPSVEYPLIGWLVSLVAFGICGICAIFWYRRGAT